MKTKLFLIILFTSIFSTYGQLVLPIDKVSGKAVFSEVVAIDSVSSDILYNRASLFATNNYNSAKTVTDLSDEKLHSIIIKAYLTSHVKIGQRIYECGGFNYSLKIYCKDGRYKYEITDLAHTGIYDLKNNASGGAIENESPECGTFLLTKKQWEYIKVDCVKVIENLIVSLKQGMINQSEVEKKDW